jgi:2-polyprenyl-3-methyl-5-hydroxy-6-metoxy-1,4-benzoquinol methylase
MPTRSQCPICQSPDYKEFITTKDHSVSGETFTIVECQSCKFHFTNPVPAEEVIGNYYKSDAYVSHSSSGKGLINKIYLQVRKYTLRQKVKLVRREARGFDLLDIGAGTGHFLNQAKQDGFNALGLEPDEDARKFARETFGITMQSTTDLDQLPDQSRDVITMWHVLEHVYHLQRDVKEIQRILKQDGVLVVAVPNMNSYDARHYKEFWAAYDLPIHLYHFTPADIQRLFAGHGWEVQKILPMKFDAYYVSMLSEKYKGGNILKALWHGFKSNWLRSNEKCSSQIYIVRRKRH